MSEFRVLLSLKSFLDSFFLLSDTKFCLVIHLFLLA